MEEFMTVEQAAKRLLVSEDFIRNLIRTKQLPAHRVGKKVYRIRTTDLDKFIEQRKTTNE